MTPEQKKDRNPDKLPWIKTSEDSQIFENEYLEYITSEYVSKRFEDSDNPTYLNSTSCQKDFKAGWQAHKAYIKKIKTNK